MSAWDDDEDRVARVARCFKKGLCDGQRLFLFSQTKVGVLLLSIWMEWRAATICILHRMLTNISKGPVSTFQQKTEFSTEIVADEGSSKRCYLGSGRGCFVTFFSGHWTNVDRRALRKTRFCMLGMMLFPFKRCYCRRSKVGYLNLVWMDI